MKRFSYLLIFALFVVSCGGNSGEEEVEPIITQRLSVTVEEMQKGLELQSEIDIKWRIEVSNDASWCSADKSTGSGDITLYFEPNESTESRSAEVVIYQDGFDTPQAVVDIEQLGAANIDIPLVFHILHKDNSDRIPESRINTILTRLNNFYDGKVSGVNTNIQFVLADRDESGAAITGINYVSGFSELPLDVDKFMDGESAHSHLLWDPNNYINIFIFPFSEDNALGVSHLPYTTEGIYELEGTLILPYTHIEKESLHHVHSVCINSKYIDEESDMTWHRPNDIHTTIAHEIGHYLGLRHTFSEDDDGSYANSTNDTDFCEDTPSYNRVAYIDYFNAYGDNMTLDELFERTSGDGKVFSSNNVMDYFYSEGDRITKDQRLRIRHILNFGVMMPVSGSSITKGEPVVTKSGVVIPSKKVR